MSAATYLLLLQNVGVVIAAYHHLIEPLGGVAINNVLRGVEPSNITLGNTSYSTSTGRVI